jgi:hypothetical protein
MYLWTRTTLSTSKLASSQTDAYLLITFLPLSVFDRQAVANRQMDGNVFRPFQSLLLLGKDPQNKVQNLTRLKLTAGGCK